MGFITLSQKDASQLYYDEHFFRDNKNKNDKEIGGALKLIANVFCQAVGDNIDGHLKFLR